MLNERALLFFSPAWRRMKRQHVEIIVTERLMRRVLNIILAVNFHECVYSSTPVCLTNPLFFCTGETAVCFVIISHGVQLLVYH